MPTPTYPSAAQVLATAKAAGGRVSSTRNEIIRLLREKLPLIIAEANTQDGVSIPTPENYVAARETFEDLKAPIIAVGLSISYANVVARVRFPVVTAMVYVIANKGDTRVDVDDLWDLAELARLTMQPTDAGWCLPDGRRVWSACVPNGITQLPADFDKYMGVAVEFEINQAGIDLWTPAA